MATNAITAWLHRKTTACNPFPTFGHTNKKGKRMKKLYLIHV
jgi:hypothetical protein